MESEKIKKGLECCSILMDNTKTAEEQDNACSECPYRKNDRCSWKLDADALALINELESRVDCVNKHLQEFTHKVIGKLKDNVNADNVDIFVQCKGIINETLKEFTK